MTIVDQHYQNGILLLNYLRSQKEISLLNEAENSLVKTLLLSAASFFEKEIKETVMAFANSRSKNDSLITSLIKTKAVDRQYHAYFDWDDRKGGHGRFLGMFGEDFKKKVKEKISSDDKLEVSVKSFLEIGQERNKIVHQNYAEIVIEKTAEEVYQLYKAAIPFIVLIKSELILKEE